jgi:hypothetical protein
MSTYKIKFDSVVVSADCLEDAVEKAVDELYCGGDFEAEKVESFAFSCSGREE